MQSSILQRSHTKFGHSVPLQRAPTPHATPLAYKAHQQLQSDWPAAAPKRVRHATHPQRVVRARIFDGLKNLIPGGFGGSNSKAQPSQAAEAEEDEAEEEGTEMVRLDSESGGLAEDQGVFGPLAVLLVGFTAEEVEAFRAFMLEMEADMVKIVPCSPAQMAGTLQAALESEFPQYEQPPLGTRRTVFLSGMVGAEVVEVIAAYKEAGMPPTVWAAAVPNNYGRIVGELAEEVHADNAAMVRRSQEAQMRRMLEEEQSTGQ